MSRIANASKLLDRFENVGAILPADAERLVVEILEACGHVVTEKGFIEGEQGVDCFFRTDIDGRSQLIGVEVKSRMQPAGIEFIEQAFRMRESGHFDRAMVISRSGFSRSAISQADAVGLGQIDLLAPSDLRNWLAKNSGSAQTDKTYDIIIRAAMQKLARHIAEYPDALITVEWRDLERVLREAFEGLGFETKLTRPGKDGGFDLELHTTRNNVRDAYLVEVKHWTNQKPGAPHLEKLIRVTASKAAAGGLLLSTSGFTNTIYSGIATFSAPVRLADGQKIVSLCKAYYRLGSALWLEAASLHDTLFAGTRAIGEHT